MTRYQELWKSLDQATLQRAWRPVLASLADQLASRFVRLADKDQQTLRSALWLAATSLVEVQGLTMFRGALDLATRWPGSDRQILHRAQMIWAHTVATTILTALGLHAKDDTLTTEAIEAVNMDDLITQLLEGTP